MTSVSNFVAEEERMYGTEPKNFIYVLSDGMGDQIADVLRKYAYNVISGSDPRKVADPCCVGVVVPITHARGDNAKALRAVAGALDIPVHTGVEFSFDSKTITLVRLTDGDLA